MATPRTDQHIQRIYSPGNHGMGDDYAEEVVEADFCKKLEEELNIAITALEFYALEENWKERDTGMGLLHGKAEDLGNRATEALEQIKNL